MSPPELHVVFPFEGTPYLAFDVQNEGEKGRLIDWLSASPPAMDALGAVVDWMAATPSCEPGEL